MIDNNYNEDYNIEILGVKDIDDMIMEYKKQFDRIEHEKTIVRNIFKKIKKRRKNNNRVRKTFHNILTYGASFMTSYTIGIIIAVIICL